MRYQRVARDHIGITQVIMKTKPRGKDPRGFSFVHWVWLGLCRVVWGSGLAYGLGDGGEGIEAGLEFR